MSDQNHSNLDPLSDEPGAHPVGTGVGAVVGGLAGKATAEMANPTAQDAYWRQSHTRESYYQPGLSYEQDYRPAYALGWSPVGAAGGPFEAVEPRLRERWERERELSSLDWDQARAPARAAWERLYGSTATEHLAHNPAAIPLPAGTLDNEGVVDVLNNLMELCRDGEQGFRASADHATTGELQGFLSRRAGDCALAAAELEHVVRSYGAEPAEGGTMAGALHRGWVAIKAALSSNDDKAVLEECERGEDAMVAHYRSALEKPLPASVRVLVQRQSEEAQRYHDEVRTLRDRYTGNA